MNKYLLIVSLILSVTAHADPSKWTDANGEVHYSDHPPENAQVKKLHFEDMGGTPPVDNIYAPKSTKEMEADFQRAKDLRDKQAKKEEQARADAAAKQANCATARNNLSVMQQSRRMFSTNENGERIYLDDDQRQQQLDAGQQAVSQFCN
ncbi:MAG: DUF4124 domain-containing protein [Gallionella sp.]